MGLREFEGKTIRVRFADGDLYQGKGFDYTSALDNTGEVYNGVETLSIAVSLPYSQTVIKFEFAESEIEEIEILDP